MSAYIYRPELTFEATNIVGNIYFTNFLSWQGACREKFLKERAPGVLKMVIERKIVLHTSSVSCDFSDPAGASVNDQIVVEMRLIHLRGGRLTVAFDYFRELPGQDPIVRQSIATGKQGLCCKHPSETGLAPAVFPREMLEALRPFAESDQVKANIDEALEFSASAAPPLAT